MSISQNETTMEIVMTRLAELEEANTRMQAELAILRAAKFTTSEQNVIPPRQPAITQKQQVNRPKRGERRKSRRGVLRNGLGMAAALGAAAFMELGTLPASAHSPQPHGVIPDDHIGNFSSSNGSTPAVTATGTNGSQGVNAASDFGAGLSATSSNGYGLQAASTSSHAIFAQSHGGDGLHAIGGGGSTNSAVYASGGAGYGLYAQSKGGTAVYAQNFNGTALYAQSTNSNAIHAVSGGNNNSALYAQGLSGYGVFAISNADCIVGESSTGSGVRGSSTSGAGVTAKSPNGTALVVQGTVQVQGNAVGVVNLPAGQTSVTVTSPAATPASNINLTALTYYHGTVWVTRSSGRFTLNISVSQGNNVSFSYLIIN